MNMLSRAATEAVPTTRGLDLGGILISILGTLPLILGVVAESWAAVAGLLLEIGLAPDLITRVGAVVALLSLIYTGVTRSRG